MSKTQPWGGGRFMVLMAGTAMVGAAAVVGLTGLALGGAAIVSGIRRRVERMEVPPRELAHRQWQHARSALSSGARAWHSSTVARQDGNAVPAGTST
ncbi:hypothetical protein Val02_47980 [Virgisporangium aliadipatigenens]|uniref:Uncharacterized protein n=1 Tax=Virgisporangium aliadipatigenens TaxID=741659 RepID=A0A8J3YNY9_9ACTN|nr:hypothetical protein [Virgisporangium aliadipatigenens]GIJ47912.1 hypothetical protein Val02_47980 [Virgisporangium aliadipatigenens]